MHDFLYYLDVFEHWFKDDQIPIKTIKNSRLKNEITDLNKNDCNALYIHAEEGVKNNNIEREREGGGQDPFYIIKVV